MPEENKEKIKKLELDLKTAFKDEKFDEAKKLAEELKAADPENHLAERLSEKMKEAEAEQLRKANAEKIKDLEKQLKQAFKAGNLPDVDKLSDEIKKLDPESKTVKKIQANIDKAKSALEAQSRKEEIKGLIAEIKELMKNEEWNKAKEKTDELLKMDEKNRFALKTLKKVEKNKKEKPKELKAAPLSEVEKPVPPAPSTAEGEKAVEPEKAGEATPEEKIRHLEEELNQALKEGHEPHMNSLMGEIRRLDPENKTVKKVQAKLDKEKAKLEAQSKKEKIKGLTTEIKELMKNEEWDKAKEKANELLKTDEKNRFALKTLKKIEKKEGVKEAVPEKAVEEKPKEEEKPVVEARPEEAKAVPVAPEVPKEEAPSVVKPVQPVHPKAEEIKPEPEKVAAPPAKPEVKPMAAAPLGTAKKPTPAEEKGNIFTKLFGKKEAVEKPKSIIDTIVAGTERVEEAEKKRKRKEEGEGEGFLRFATAFLEFSIAFILISAGFFYAQSEPENRILSLAGIEENQGSRLHAANQALSEKKKEERELNQEIERYKQGYEDENIKTINQIVETRLDWNDLIQKLNEVTEFVYEKNVLAQYVQYNNYSYDVPKAQLTVNGTLSDPLGKNLTKLAELEEAFIYYPKDKDDPLDTRKPYFYGLKEFRAFTKTFNKATGRYVSNFSLTLYTKEIEEK